MKIITENAAYVQNNDIFYLLNTDILIPYSIFKKFFSYGIGRYGVVIIDENNKCEFEKFEDSNEIEFFKKLDWIVDYNSIKDLTDDEIIKMQQNITQSKNQIAHQLNLMSTYERMKNPNIATQCTVLDAKKDSLNNFLYFKHGLLKMNLPKGIDYPEGFSQNNENEIQKLMKKSFPKMES